MEAVAPPGTIFAMGGGGFTMEPDNPVLDEFILGLSARREPRICFLPTASGDPDAHIARFYAAYRDLPCEPSHISLFRLGAMPRTPPLRELLLSQDIVYVGGGSMRNMLAIWGVHQLDAILREAWERGVVLAGLSAGAMCWFEGGITKSTGDPEVAAGRGLLPGSRPSPPENGAIRVPNDAVTPLSNQHIEPAQSPASTTPRSHASRRIASTPWARHTASMFTVLPPPT